MIKLRGKVWYARITTRDAANRQVQKWFKLPEARSERDARREEVRLKQTLTHGVGSSPARFTVGQYLEEWLAGARPDLATRTGETYAGYLRRQLIPQLGAIPLAKLSTSQIRTAYAVLRERGRTDGMGGLSAQTVLHCHRLLKEALRQAVADGLLVRNPAETVKAPVPEETTVRVLTEPEVMRLIEASTGTPLYLPILLAATTGLRRGEVLGLQWEDVDLERGTLTVRRSAERTQQGLGYKPPKTRSSRRTVLLLPLAIAALREHRRRALPAAWIVTNAAGQPLTPDALTQAFPALLRRHGLPPMRFHDLRHSHASLLIKQGAPMKAISARLGHASIRITMDTYGHLLPGVEEEAVERLENALQQRAAAE